MTATTQHQQLESFYAGSTLRQPVTMQQPETAKNVTVYLNGDKYNPGKRLVVNRKHVQNFDGFLTMVTNGLKPSFGAVRQIYTPNHGRKVTELKDIGNGMSIVAGGSERFRKLAYQEISTKRQQPQKPRPEIKPVIHSKMNVAARWKEVSRGPCNIYIYGNGDINGAAVKLLLIPRILKRWDMVLQEVTEKIAFRTGQACRRLYTLEGVQVFGSDQLENGRYYVSVGNERFKRLPYGERAQHMAMVASTKRTQHHLPPLARRGHTNTGQPGDSTYSQKYAARRQLEEDRAYQSHPPTVGKPSSHRRLRPIRGPAATEPESTVFRGKPMKVKRSSATGKLTQVEDEDDVFRAKRRGVVAEEVADDDDTKVDLPIDQVPADVVEEEEYPQSSRRRNSGADDGNYQRESSSQPKQTYAPRIDEDDSDLTAPSKTPTSARRNEPEATTRSEPSEQKPNSYQSARQSISPTKVDDDELKMKNDAAIVIQSGYRGYRARNTLKSQRKDSPPNPTDDASDVQATKSEYEEEHQYTPPETVLQSTSPPPEDNTSPSHEGVIKESRESNSPAKESSWSQSRELVLEDRPDDSNEPQPSPVALAGQPLSDSKNDEDGNCGASESLAADIVPEETQQREATPLENTHPDEQSPQPDVLNNSAHSPSDTGNDDQTETTPKTYVPDNDAQSPANFGDNHPTSATPQADVPGDGAHSPSTVGNDEGIATTRSDEAAGLPERDDGDGTDDEKHRNLSPTPKNDSEPREDREESDEPQEKSPRSGQLTPNDAPVESPNMKKVESQEDGLNPDGQNRSTEDAN